MEPIKTDIVVLGAGPGGYTAAFYAADKGKKVLLVDKDKRLGGVCLNRGCIPSKAYLHAAHLLYEAKESKNRGITFGEPKLDLPKLREWKESILDKLSGGIHDLSKMRNVDVMHGRGYFEDSSTLRVETEEGQKFVKYGKAILATGSIPAMPADFDLGNERIMTSDDSLELPEVPKDLLVIGGGYIGMELGTVYSAMGSRVILVEALDDILMGADRDLVKYVTKAAERSFHEIRRDTKVQKMATEGKKIKVNMQVGDADPIDELYDRVLVCVGRTPCNKDMGFENTQVTMDQKGFVEVNKNMQTQDPNIYAIGDLVGGALLAHKASREARIAIDVMTGEPNAFENIIVPAVVFTNPELAWAGLTENEAKKEGIEVKVARFPWTASGRALSFDRTDGMTKLLIEPETERILGVGIVGVGAGEMISEGAFAIEMGATAEDLAETIHPHPTLSETIMECAEHYYGTATHTFARKK